MAPSNGKPARRWQWRVSLVLAVLVLLVSFLSPLSTTKTHAAAENSVYLAAVMAPLDSGAPNTYKNIIFLHHSVGQDLIQRGNMRALLFNLGYEFWDHDYNGTGLNRPTSTAPYYVNTGSNYLIPNDNTDIVGGLRDIFRQPLYTSGVSALPNACTVTGHGDIAFTCLMRHKVIIIKSCYPNADITSDSTLEAYKTVYREIVARAAQYPDHIFITLGFPPLRSEHTTQAAADRARAFTTWLRTSPDITSTANFFVYDFFNELANAQNFLKQEYRATDVNDDHPNALADQTVGPKVVTFIDTVINAYSETHP